MESFESVNWLILTSVEKWEMKNDSKFCGLSKWKLGSINEGKKKIEQELSLEKWKLGKIISCLEYIEFKVLVWVQTDMLFESNLIDGCEFLHADLDQNKDIDESRD